MFQIDAPGKKYPGFGISQGKKYKVRMALQYAVESGKFKKVRGYPLETHDTRYLFYKVVHQVSGTGLAGTYRIVE